MKIVYHPEFPRDIRRYREQYDDVFGNLGKRFANEIDGAIERIKRSPASAGHFVNSGSIVVSEFRRVNLPTFPFFVLYGIGPGKVIVGSIIPTASDPLTWLNRFRR